MKPVVFTGTSITHSDARTILEAEYRPPVKRNDIRNLLKSSPEIIGIIDGVFFDSAAVAHREIIEAIRSGVIVVGGASMGALRASELDSYGMIGVGRIYEMYRNGVIESDDEVAVTFDAETGDSLSVPLVNIRMTAAVLLDGGLLSKQQAAGFIDIARKTFYPDRNYRKLINECEKNGIIDGSMINALMAFIDKNRVDVKRQDAVIVLEKIKELCSVHEI